MQGLLEFYHPKDFSPFNSETVLLPDDEYELGELFASKLKPFMEDPVTQITMKVKENGNTVYSFQVISKKGGSLVIEA